jgi:DNA-binding transcriptional regulator YdaS (Cro superfamily)
MILSAEEIKDQQRAQLNQLLAWIGSRKRLADTIGVTPQAVYEMVKRGRISTAGATAIHRATEGRFDRAVMRPDVTTWAEDL